MSDMNGNDEKSGHEAPPNSPVTRPNEPTKDPNEDLDKASPEAENPDSEVIPIYLEDVGEPPISPAEPANRASNPAGTIGGGNCSDQGPSSGSPAEDKTTPDTKDPPPGSASGDGGDNRVGQDHFMREILEEAS